MNKLLLLLPILLCGCSAFQHPVPSNRIEAVTPMGKYAIATPKNVLIKGFELVFETNGTAHVKFESWKSENDPLVIDKASAGQVATIGAWSGLLNSAVEKAAEGAAKGVKP